VVSTDNYLQVGEVMTRSPVVISVGSSVAKAAKRMEKYGVGSIVITDKRVLKGILTFEDIVHKVIAKSKDAKSIVVDDIMSTNIISISPEKDIYNAVAMLSVNEVDQLPVLAEGRMVGLITIKDILRIEPTLFDLVVDYLHTQEERRQDILDDTYVDENDLL